MDDNRRVVQVCPYQYEPLDEGQIRILYIHKTTIAEGVLAGAIYHTMPWEVDYTAISYTWSTDPSSDESAPILLVDAVEVKVDDETTRLGFTSEPRQFVMVKEGMRKMLDALGNVDPPREGEYESSDSVICTALWIDEICINQSDQVEKASQIKMMHEVYRDAKNTVVYLGEPTQDTDVAFETAFALAALKNIPTDEIPGWYFDGLSSVHRTRQIDWVALKDMPMYKRHYVDLQKKGGNLWTDFNQHLLGSRWFERTWTLQEIMCTREAQVKMGRFSIPWDDLVSACKVARRCGLSFGVHSHCEQVPVLEDFRQMRLLDWSGLPETDEELHDTIRSYVERSIPSMLPMSLGRGVSLPQDKVFALFNIISERITDHENEDKYTSLIDYSLSVREVYIRVAQLWHSGSRNSQYNIARPGISAEKLSFLDYVVSATENAKAGLPSWVPHWDAHNFAMMMSDRSMTGCQASQGQEAHVVFPDASAFLHTDVPLIVRGVRLMKVHQSFAGLKDGKADFEHHAAMLSEFSDPYPTTEMTYLEAYPKALYPEDCDWACNRPRTSKVWEFLKNRGEHSSAPREQPYTTAQIINTLPDMMQLAGVVVFKALALRRTLITTNEGFLGLAPGETMPGDEVVLFFGGRTPYVIRRLDSGKFRFMGHCFVLGIMKGEALDELPEDRVENIVLV